MKKKFCLLIAFCFISVFGFSVFAQVNVGLNQGDWVEYDVTYTGSPPESYPEKLRIGVQTIEGTSITVEIKRGLLNGTQDSKTVTFDLESGALDLIIIPANLGAGDEIYHEDMGNFTLEGVSNSNFIGVARDGVYANVVQTEFSWDRSTGILVEAYSTTDTFTETLQAVSTNIVLTQTSDIDPMLLYATIVAAIIIVVVVVLFVFKKKK